MAPKTRHIAFVSIALLLLVSTILICFHGAITTGLVRWALGKASRDIPGQLRIGSAEMMGLGRVRLFDFRILDERGEDVIVGETVEGDCHPIALLRGELLVESIVVREGSLFLQEGADGKWNIDRTFRNPNAQQESGGGLTVRLEDIELQGVELQIAARGAPRIRVSNVAGHVTVLAGAEPSQVTYRDASGQANIAGLGMRVLQADGEFHDGADTPFATNLRYRFSGETSTAQVSLRKAGNGMRLHIGTRASGFFTGLAALGLELTFD